jgi:hypothetical protein
MPREALRYIKWMALVEGIEIPVISVSAAFPVDGIAQVDIAIEPDRLLRDIRPKTKVALFAWDEYDEEIDNLGIDNVDLSRIWKMYIEGDTLEYSEAFDGSTRQTILHVSAKISALQHHKLFTMGVGTVLSGQLFSGSALYTANPDAAGADRLVLYSLMQSVFDSKVRPSQVVLPAGRTNNRRTGESTAAFSERLIRMIAYITAFNASLRLDISSY